MLSRLWAGQRILLGQALFSGGGALLFAAVIRPLPSLMAAGVTTAYAVESVWASWSRARTGTLFSLEATKENRYLLDRYSYRAASTDGACCVLFAFAACVLLGLPLHLSLSVGVWCGLIVVVDCLRFYCISSERHTAALVTGVSIAALGVFVATSMRVSEYWVLGFESLTFFIILATQIFYLHTSHNQLRTSDCSLSRRVLASGRSVGLEGALLALAAVLPTFVLARSYAELVVALAIAIQLSATPLTLIGSSSAPRYIMRIRANSDHAYRLRVTLSRLIHLLIVGLLIAVVGLLILNSWIATKLWPLYLLHNARIMIGAVTLMIFARLVAASVTVRFRLQGNFRYASTVSFATFAFCEMSAICGAFLGGVEGYVFIGGASALVAVGVLCIIAAKEVSTGYLPNHSTTTN